MWEKDLAQNDWDGYFWITEKAGFNSLFAHRVELDDEENRCRICQISGFQASYSHVVKILTNPVWEFATRLTAICGFWVGVIVLNLGVI